MERPGDRSDLLIKFHALNNTPPRHNNVFNFELVLEEIFDATYTTVRPSRQSSPPDRHTSNSTDNRYHRLHTGIRHRRTWLTGSSLRPSCPGSPGDYRSGPFPKSTRNRRCRQFGRLRIQAGLVILPQQLWYFVY